MVKSGASYLQAGTTAVVVVAIASLLPRLTWAQGSTGPVVIGETTQIQSKILKESRSLLISKPPGYDSGTDRYPVLYLLDGETHFQYTSAMANFLAVDDRVPEMLVVGIDSEDSQHRTHDLTSPSTDETDNRFSPGNGGADVFLSFMADELVPFIDKTYRTRPYRLLVGHSFGGLFAIYALVKKPHLFNAYVAADPSLYWNKGPWLRRQSGSSRPQTNFKRTFTLQFRVTLRGRRPTLSLHLQRNLLPDSDATMSR